MATPRGSRYAPFYCEENVLWLCRELPETSVAVLVTSASRSVRMRRQRAGEARDGDIVWDYHAFALSRDGDRWLAWDLDSTLPWPVPATEYLRLSFPASPEAPSFRVIDAAEYARELRSDRSHMLRPDGSWLAPPPPWPAPDGSGGVRLAELLDPARSSLGSVVTLAEMLRRYSA